MHRRSFLKHTGAAVLAAPFCGHSAQSGTGNRVDIHFHCTHRDRPDDKILTHQDNTGMQLTILLPAGETGGLAAGAAGNAHVAAFIAQHPTRFKQFANENVFRSDAPKVIEKWLKAGACGIGELKDKVACDSPDMQHVAEVAREYDVPMLIHFQDGGYNDGYSRFHRMLEKFPSVKFIGHATAFWGAIDKDYRPEHQSKAPPTLTPGGLTDRWLKDYPNFFGDLSAGSGNRALSRDAAFTKGFLLRHQDKLMYGSDCLCSTGVGPQCLGAVKLGLLKASAPPEILEKILSGNARRILRLK